MLKGLFLAVFCGMLFLITHVIVFHTMKVKRRFHTMLGILLGILPIYTLLFIIMSERDFSSFVSRYGSLENLTFFYGIFIYTLYIFFYGNLISFTDRSITTRIMVEIENAPEKKLSLERIKDLYRLDTKIYDEIRDMVRIHYIIEDKGFFKNTAKGRNHARIMKFLRSYLNLTTKE